MTFPTVQIDPDKALELQAFREMDARAIERGLPIELMMENAGLQLARLAAAEIPEKGRVAIGIGTGNNGGGGLVAARRLAGWGHDVSLHIPNETLRELPARQLERALAFGAHTGPSNNPHVFIDAYLGFSQRLPLPQTFLDAIEHANALSCLTISLDTPTGLNTEGLPFFQPDLICTLAAPKRVLYNDALHSRVFIADLGIPDVIYKEYGLRVAELGLDHHGLVELV